MIKITEQGVEGNALPDMSYIKGRRIVGKIILPITRYLRCVNVENYITNGERLLDIGCGDGFFIKRNNCKERYGLDKLLGDEIVDTLNFPNEYFDYVTMLAVIEHIEKPELIISEIHRVLKPGGKFIFTTPRKEAEGFIKLYVKGIEDEHETYFDYKRVEKMASGMFDIVGYNRFIFGLNQVFALEKK
jgi:SAM-dependent methyltransferase